MSLKTATSAPSLADLAPGEAARVLRVRGEGPASERLRELGFTAGTLVLFVRRAPMGDPLCFRLRHTELCLRRGEASLIDVEMAPAS